MALKDYSDEFKADAVALYESTPGATHKGIASGLGTSRGALRTWVLRNRERRGITLLASPSSGRTFAETPTLAAETDPGRADPPVGSPEPAPGLEFLHEPVELLPGHAVQGGAWAGG